MVPDKTGIDPVLHLLGETETGPGTEADHLVDLVDPTERGRVVTETPSLLPRKPKVALPRRKVFQQIFTIGVGHPFLQLKPFLWLQQLA